MRTLLNISILLSLLICWTYGKLYNEKKEYYHLLKNVMNRLERFEKDEILHRRNSEKDLSDSIYQQQQRQDKSRDYNSRILNMLQAEKLLKEKRNRIYHGDDLYKQIYNKNYIDEDDGYDENLVDENDNDNRDKSKESYTKTHDNPIVVTESIKMPDVSPQQQDTYLCYAHQLPSDDRYIVEFQPLAKMQIAHHMLLFGCNLPYKMNEAWKCREMAPICMGQQQIMYAWAKNAPSLVLPKDVAFHVGGDSGVNYLVLQVHYLHVSSFKNGNTDHSGLTFKMTSQVPQYFAGIYLLADGMTPIPPHRKVSHIDMGCDYSSANSLTPKIYPFRFRVHAHKLGVVITGYRVRNGVWTLIGRGDPQRPQAFNKVFNDLDIQNGDQVFGRCTYNSMNRSRVTHIGATHKDEMCNFYTMYFYKRPTSVEETNAAKSLPCSYIKNTGEWPKDSDTSLAEMERRNHISNGNKEEIHLYKDDKSWPAFSNHEAQFQFKVGQIAGVAYNELNDKIYMFRRCDRIWGPHTFKTDNTIVNKKLIKKPTIILLQSDGSIFKDAGRNRFSMPHGITVDDKGYVWVTDVGRHQVFKLSPDLKEVLLEIGHKFQKGSEPGYFCKPTDVAVMQDGSFFVADGYCNGRVVKYDKDGGIELIIDKNSFNEIQGFPHPRYMMVVHSLALDEPGDRLFVADRENGRVLIFKASTGEYTDIVKNGTFEGAVYAIAYAWIPGYQGVLHVINGPMGLRPVHSTGFTYSLDERKVISKWGPEEGFNRPHDIAVTKDSSRIFVSEIGPNRLWKFDRQTLPSSLKRERP